IVAEALASGHLVPILPKWTAESVVVNAVYVNREFMPPKVRTFIDFLAAWFAATDRHPSRT
ncbi:MAG: LysR family transcriptional regulator, partial [Gammaproteobacteria bacterium]|nr:LysR family transcriptional regulator [Gammaproteobacteria bacterium]